MTDKQVITSAYAHLWKNPEQSLLTRGHNRFFMARSKRYQADTVSRNVSEVYGSENMKDEKKRDVKNKPFYTIRAGQVSISAWKNETEKGGEMITFTPQKRYYDKEAEEYKDSTSFSVTDLITLGTLCEIASIEVIKAWAQKSKDD